MPLGTAAPKAKAAAVKPKEDDVPSEHPSEEKAPSAILPQGSTFTAAADDKRGFSQKYVADKIHIGGWPQIQTFRFWLLTFKENVAAASRDPDQAFIWIAEVQEKSFEDLADSGDFPQLDALLATEWDKIITGEFKNRVRNEKMKASDDKRRLKGRQVTKMVYEKF